jgi:hypothetical protein
MFLTAGRSGLPPVPLPTHWLTEMIKFTFRALCFRAVPPWLLACFASFWPLLIGFGNTDCLIFRLEPYSIWQPTTLQCAIMAN